MQFHKYSTSLNYNRYHQYCLYRRTVHTVIFLRKQGPGEGNLLSLLLLVGNSQRSLLLADDLGDLGTESDCDFRAMFCVCGPSLPTVATNSALVFTEPRCCFFFFSAWIDPKLPTDPE